MQNYNHYPAYTYPHDYGRPEHHRSPSYPVQHVYANYGAPQPTHNPAVPFPPGPMPRPKHSTALSRSHSQQAQQPPQYPSVHRNRHPSLDANATVIPPMAKPSKPSKPQKPLKSAMKKTPRPVTPVDMPSLSRTTTSSDPARIRANSLTRPLSREASRRHFTHNTLFVSFHGQNKLKIDSLSLQTTLLEIREKVLPMWPPGVDSQHYNNDRNELMVQFSGRPWNEKGELGVMAMKLILKLWSVLGNLVHNTNPDQVYACESMIHSVDGNEPARIVFALCDKLQTAHHFIICFTEKRRKLKLVGDNMGGITGPLAEHLRSAFPQQVSAASWRSDESFKIEMRSSGFENIVDLFLAEVLHFIIGLGYKLDVGIPIPSNSQSFLGLTARKEVWIFTSLAKGL